MKRIFCYLKAIPFFLKSGVWCPHVYHDESKETAIIISNDNGFRVSNNWLHGENERVHNVEYKYLVHLECDKSHVSHIVDKDKWESLKVGQEISGEKNQYGQINVDWDNINNTNE